MVELSLTVGKLDASLALLLTKDQHLIEFPTILLPDGVRAGLVVKIKCEQDNETEIAEAEEFRKLQQEIVNTFGRNLPLAPKLRIRNVTQTSCVLEWDPLDLGSSTLKNLVMYKDGIKLGLIAQPLVNRTSKLSGLPIDKKFLFQLRLDTTSGIYLLDVVEVTTHKMTDLTGITVCLGDFSANDPFTAQDLNDVLAKVGANHPAQDKIKVDTTHFLCTRENKSNPEFNKAVDMNIPVVRPEWLKACERERRIVGVRDFYTKDCVLPDILAKNYWQGLDGKKENGIKAEAASGNNVHPLSTDAEQETQGGLGTSDAPEQAVRALISSEVNTAQVPAVSKESCLLDLAEAPELQIQDTEAVPEPLQFTRPDEEHEKHDQGPPDQLEEAAHETTDTAIAPLPVQETISVGGIAQDSVVETDAANGHAQLSQHVAQQVSPLNNADMDNLSQMSLVDEPISDTQDIVDEMAVRYDIVNEGDSGEVKLSEPPTSPIAASAANMGIAEDVALAEPVNEAKPDKIVGGEGQPELANLVTEEICLDELQDFEGDLLNKNDAGNPQEHEEKVIGDVGLVNVIAEETQKHEDTIDTEDHDGDATTDNEESTPAATQSNQTKKKKGKKGKKGKK